MTSQQFDPPQKAPTPQADLPEANLQDADPPPPQTDQQNTASIFAKLSIKKWSRFDWLWAAIIVGLTLRFLYPFVDNPFRHLNSDSDRHFLNATLALNYNIFGACDALGYQLWLGAAARIFGKSWPVVACYAGIMSAATPYFWYLWFKECLPTKSQALIAYLILVWMPDWIKIYSYFLDETLLLPVVGLMLYFGWKARKTLILRDSIIFAALVGIAFITKATSAPVAAITYALLAKTLLANFDKREVAKRLAICVLTSIAICSLGPISFHSRTGSWAWYLPAQTETNKWYFLSGKKTMVVKTRYFDRYDGQWKNEDYWFGCPSYYTPQLVPFSDWISPRTGSYDSTLDYGQPPATRFMPKPDLSWKKRIELTGENLIYLFVGFVWPVEFPQSTVNFERWLWPIYTLIILGAAIKRRKLTELDMLCFGSLLILMFQQECVVEGRHRMTWEGVVIPALVLALSGSANRKPKIG